MINAASMLQQLCPPIIRQRGACLLMLLMLLLLLGHRFTNTSLSRPAAVVPVCVVLRGNQLCERFIIDW